MTTRTYSTSFSLGIYFLNSRLRDAIHSIYAFVRIADEIVDSFEGYDKEFLLKKFRADTYQAIEKGISANPVINSFQYTVKKYSIENELIELFLKSMEMDLEKIEYSSKKYEKYILGSAESVGLMCLHVFTEGDKMLYDELKPYAMKLGAAFQKVNFLRDIKEDYHILGRVYFPGVDLENFTEGDKKQIESEIEKDFKIALQGIKKLPASSRGNVYLCYVYYRSLFKKIKKLPPQHILSNRVRINNAKKIGLMLNSILHRKLKLI